MKKFEQLGRSLSQDEQKAIVGGLASGAQCVCDGEVYYCTGDSVPGCASSTMKKCDGNSVFCSPSGGEVPN